MPPSRPQKAPPSPSLGQGRRRRTTYPQAMARIEALSRISGQLAALRSEPEVMHSATGFLGSLFEGVRSVEAYLVDRASGTLVSTGAPADRDLMAMLCAGLRAAQPADAPLADVMPLLSVPHLLTGDPADGRAPMMSAPVLDGPALLGLLVVEADSRSPDFTRGELETLGGTATQLSLVVARLRSEKARAEGRHLQRDLELAREIQRRFLPSLPPELSAFRVTAEYRPAFNVGGDFYDVYPSGPDQVTAVIGDVAGKGVAAALVMARVSSEFRRLVGGHPMPLGEMLAELNESVVEEAPNDRFVTAACVRLDARRRRLVVANAGHLWPIVRRASGVVQVLGHAAGLPLGVFPSQSYPDEEFPLAEGDVILLMTDGVVEALDGTGADILDVVAAAPHDLNEIHRRVLHAVDHASDVRRRPDDVTLLSLQVREHSPYVVS